MASESGGDHGETLSGYISHHLHYLSSKEQHSIFDLSVVHWDTIVSSLVCAAIVLLVLRLAARRATAGVPGKFQTAVEMLVEMVEEQAKTMVHGSLKYIAPLALTVFCWVTVMNAVDLLPVDWFPTAARKLGVPYLRPLPTADLNLTFGLALGVLLLAFYYSIKIKGLGGFLHELIGAPFGQTKLTLNPLSWLLALLLGVANLAMNIIEYVGRTFSHGMRLFGNMYAGELIFFLIAGLGGSVTVVGIALHLITGTAWAIFHILIVLLQAFVFMMLTLAYIGQAHAHH
ncbi:MAG TPA: F0F1 ATP synthase subunit A [Steroidobacteraceae bacterium]